MEFSAVTAEVVEYLSKSGTALSITKVDEQNCELHLSLVDSNLTFYISCPSSDGSSWNVWSDSDKCQEILQHVMDSCDLSSCRNVSAILEAVIKSFKSSQKSSDHQQKVDQCASNSEEYSDNESGDDDEDDEECDLDDYYCEQDSDAQLEIAGVNNDMEERELASNYFSHSGSEMAVKRLVKDLKSLRCESHKFGIAAEPKGHNLFVWEVKLFDIPEDSKLGQDLAQYARRYKTEPTIHLNMQFPEDYPFSPPFIRVVKPRFKFLTGHVTIGGSICMQMLTKSGWQPTNDIESILIQVRAEILSDAAASLDVTSPNHEYSETEARMAFQRMVQKYGW